MSPKLVIGIAGMPGSGKSLVCNVARLRGIPVISMGDVVRKEAQRLGLPITRFTLSQLAITLRKQEGLDAIAKRCIHSIEKLKAPVVVIDGLRSPFEYFRFKKSFPDFKLIFVHASPGTRFRRLILRGREDDPQDWFDFIARDLNEIKLGIPALVILSDYILVNENKPLEKVLEEANLLLEVILSYANKSCSRGRHKAY